MYASLLKFVEHHQRRFLAAFVVSGTINGASRATRVAKTTHYRWLRTDDQYRQRFEQAKAELLEVLEEEARFRALEGMKRYKFTKEGKPIKHPETGEPYYEVVRSERCLELLLRSLAPEKYGDAIAHFGPHGGPIQVNHTIEELKRVVDTARRDETYVELELQRALATNAHAGTNGHHHQPGPLGNGATPGPD